MNSHASIHRDARGIRHVLADDHAGLYWGMGRCHAADRGMQMLLQRIFGRGQACEFLDGSDAMLSADRFFRRMNWSGGTEQLAGQLPEPQRRLCQAYCDGVNSVLSRKIPWELRLLGYRPTPWTIADLLLLSRMTGYIGLAQSQARAEQVLVEMVHAGVQRPLLDELFPGILAGLDEDLLRKVKLTERIVPDSVEWNAALPRMMASNNWVVSGKLTASGKPILANDPHLEINRLPAIWYEIVLRSADRYMMGASMPGLPGVIIGRTPDLSWGVTYAFADAIDSWIEDCRDGGCRRDGDAWVPFVQRKEIIRRKRRPPVEVTFYENEHGTLYGDPNEEGHYLATRWSAAESGCASLCSFAGLWDARCVEEGMTLLGRVESAFNWVLADRSDNIGYQMSGLLPRRREGVSGFVPLPGWEKENDWQGFLSPDELPRSLNPDAGYFITANHDLNSFGQAAPMNIAMAPHRFTRIEQLLAHGSTRTDTDKKTATEITEITENTENTENTETGNSIRDDSCGFVGSSAKFTADDMCGIQYDVHSVHAEGFMRILRPLLPDTSQGKLLRDWDCRYEPASQGAFLFERFYDALLQDVIGQVLGPSAAEYLQDQTTFFAAFFGNADRILLSENSGWFNGESRDEIFRRVSGKALAIQPCPWCDEHQTVLPNILFQGKLPRFLGFDRGPLVLPGGRATVCQSQLFRSAGRSLAVAASYRLVTDMASDEILTILCGGQSDRRFSRFYASDLPNWSSGRYKHVAPLGE